MLDALMAAGREAGQHVHVLRSVANALGDLGRAAAPALPLLEQLAQQPRVRWAAQAAMGKIDDAR
jgi:HEAT repeat protein